MRSQSYQSFTKTQQTRSLTPFIIIKYEKGQSSSHCHFYLIAREVKWPEIHWFGITFLLATRISKNHNSVVYSLSDLFEGFCIYANWKMLLSPTQILNKIAFSRLFVNLQTHRMAADNERLTLVLLLILSISHSSITTSSCLVTSIKCRKALSSDGSVIVRTNNSR